MTTALASRPTDQGTLARCASFALKQEPAPLTDNKADGRTCPEPLQADGSISEILPTADNKRRETDKTDGYLSASDESDKSESEKHKKKDESAEPKAKKAKTNGIEQDELPSEDPERTEKLVASVAPKTPEAKSEDELADSTQPLNDSDEPE